MKSTPCNVCGSTDLNLVDGYYYCVECGTQDVNVQETVVEQTVLADGTFAHTTSRKLTNILTDGMQMGGEWCKWHAFNFMLAGLTEELLSLGVKESFKQKVLWIWIRYIKQFQVKEEIDNTQESDKINSEFIDDTKQLDENSLFEATLNDGIEDLDKIKKSRRKVSGKQKGINVITKGTLFAILYVALNLDRSNIQLSHLFRFVNEGRLSIYNCTKFVPTELDTKCIPHWKNLLACTSRFKPMNIRVIAMSLFKKLNLGLPIVPDLTRIFDSHLKELCLPLDFRNFVLSLTHLIPCDFLQLDVISIKNLTKIPDYEGVCMTYTLLGLKICFGLDCDYEIKLSNIVDNINFNENHLKSYKLGFNSEPSDRLFSFQDWYKFIQFRKISLCKNYSPMAMQYKLPADDTVLMEHMDERVKKKELLANEVTMDIINKIPQNDNFKVIPKKEFPATTTPLTEYSELILKYSQDPDLNLLLCEDFTQYSLKYATEMIEFTEYEDKNHIIVGVSEINKILNSHVLGNLVSYKKGDMSLVFVRNCENKNWLETKPPNSEHITIGKKEDSIDRVIDHGYDSNSESLKSQSIEINNSNTEGNPVTLDDENISQIIEEESENKSIFDDSFTDCHYFKESIIHEDTKVDFEFNNCSKNENEVETLNEPNNVGYESSDSYIDPDNIDRDKLILELIELACKKYKIPKPKENSEPRKKLGSNKRKLSEMTTEVNKAKKRKSDSRSKPGEVKASIDNIISSYYKCIESDILNQVSEQVKLIVKNVEIQMASDVPNANDTINVSNLNDNEIITQDCPENNNNDNDMIQDTTHTGITDPANMQDSIIDEEETLLKGDPDFDKETHDIKQLYLELKDDFDVDDCTDINDKDLIDIIDKKLIENSKNELILEKKGHSEDSSEDSDDDFPLSVLQEEQLSMTKKTFVQQLEPLIQNSPKTFNMWFRHYKSLLFISGHEMTDKFDLELNDNCPESFAFVIRECAAIIDCSAYSLYKFMQTLEQKLLSQNYLYDSENLTEKQD